MIGYGTRVMTPAGTGMVVGTTSRTYRVLLDGYGGRTNRGRHSGEGITRGFPFSQVFRSPPCRLCMDGKPHTEHVFVDSSIAETKKTVRCPVAAQTGGACTGCRYCEPLWDAREEN